MVQMRDFVLYAVCAGKNRSDPRGKLPHTSFFGRFYFHIINICPSRPTIGIFQGVCCHFRSIFNFPGSPKFVAVLKAFIYFLDIDPKRFVCVFNTFPKILSFFFRIDNWPSFKFWVLVFPTILMITFSAFQRSAFQRSTAGNDVVATIIICLFSFFPRFFPVFFSPSRPFLIEGVLGSKNLFSESWRERPKT